MQFDEFSSFLDCDTGLVETVSHELLGHAETGEDVGASLPEWQQPEWETARRIVSAPEKFLHLPTKRDIHEWAIMQDFSQSVESGRIREELLRAMHGVGAFRKFREALHRHGVESAWYAFRAEALKHIAIEWCEENHILWT